jgi:hypothetical protein
MRPPDALLLAIAFRFHSSLTNIDLRGYKIGQEGKRAIGTALLCKPNNQLLTCTCNEFSIRTRQKIVGISGILEGPGDVTLIAGLLQNNKSVTTLRLPNNPLVGSFIGFDFVADWQGIVDLTRMLRVNTTIQTLNLSSSCLRGRGCQIVCECLKRNKTITDLNLSDNELDPSAAEILASMLIQNRALATLNLSQNELCLREEEGYSASMQDTAVEFDSDDPQERTESEARPAEENDEFVCKGMQELANAVKLNSGLKELTLFKFALPIAFLKGEGMEKGATVEGLDLSQQMLAPEDGFVIAKCIESNISTIYLDLSHNNLGKSVVSELVVSMKVWYN